ncbi:MAG: PHP domain-containing protein [candidate division WOR-3 bacterium]
MYIPILYHSNYGRGGSDFKTLFETLKDYQIPACGIVDDAFFGLYEFLTRAKEYGIKPLIGARVTVSGDQNRDPEKKFAIYLFIKNRIGYTNLCSILTRHAFQMLDTNFIKNHAAGLILITNAVPALEEFASAFAGQYYLLLPGASYMPDKKVPVVGANEIFYVKPQEKVIYRLLSKIKKFPVEDGNKKISYLIKPDQFIRFYEPQSPAIKNSLRIAEECSYLPDASEWIFPYCKKSLAEIIKPFHSRLNGQEKRRLESEYKIIKEMGFEPYFVLIYELKEFAQSQGIRMNVRGSAAASFILYLLGLSVVNPIKYQLPFERFLNQKRREPPDIDVDVEFNQRERLIDAIYKKFGNNHVARLSMINRFQIRARFRDTARAFGITPEELKNIKDHLGEKLVAAIMKLGEQIDGYPRAVATHPSGIVITPEPVVSYVPLYPGPLGAITQLDKEGIGVTGLVKIDILGVRGFPELYLKRETIDFADASVYRFLGEARTIGCFQIESPMVRQILKKIRPQSLLDIANAIAIIRPGPAQGGMKERFIKRLNNAEKITYPHPDLKDILQETLGIPIYQEQILNIANRFAGFSLEEADLLRRAMTKERNSTLMTTLREKFFQQAQASGYSRKETEQVWQRIAAFSSFSFNKAHSITYATLAYLSAYQKFYNPLEFFCRLLNNEGGYYPLHAYLNEARRWGIKILGPDINKSDWGFTIKDGALITGFRHIRNLSFSTFEKILRFRPFNNAEHLFVAVKPDIEEGLNLIRSGALNLFGESWSALYFKLLKSVRTTSRRSSREQTNLLLENINAEYFGDFNQQDKYKAQLYTLGFLPDQHILEFLYPNRSVKLSEVRGKKEEVDVVGLVIARRIICTSKHRFISFYTIDDETDHLEAVVFQQLEDDKAILKMKGRFVDDCFYVRVL